MIVAKWVSHFTGQAETRMTQTDMAGQFCHSTAGNYPCLKVCTSIWCLRISCQNARRFFWAALGCFGDVTLMRIQGVFQCRSFSNRLMTSALASLNEHLQVAGSFWWGKMMSVSLITVCSENKTALSTTCSSSRTLPGHS